MDYHNYAQENVKEIITQIQFARSHRKLIRGVKAYVAHHPYQVAAILATFIGLNYAKIVQAII